MRQGWSEGAYLVPWVVTDCPCLAARSWRGVNTRRLASLARYLQSVARSPGFRRGGARMLAGPRHHVWHHGVTTGPLEQAGACHRHSPLLSQVSSVLRTSRTLPRKAMDASRLDVQSVTSPVSDDSAARR